MDTQEQAGRPEPQLSFARQGGWAGLIVLLVALVIVAVLAQTALRRYGLLAGAASPAKTATAPGPRDANQAEPDPATVAPTPRNALERARGVQAEVRRQADEVNKQIEDTAK